MPKLKPVVGARRRTNPIVWLAAIICAFLAVAVIITGMVVFVGYLVIRPKVPAISVRDAHLDKFYYDQASLLTTQVSVVIRAENNNAKAHASFYDLSFILSFHGLELAKLVAEPFDVGKNDSVEFNYLVESSPVPLGPREADIVDTSIKLNQIVFDLRGNARTRWRVGLLGSVKFWLHLNCQLRFFINGTATRSFCSTRSK